MTKEEFIRQCAELYEEYSRYGDLLDELLENPPNETQRRTADDVAEEGLRIWYQNRKQGQ